MFSESQSAISESVTQLTAKRLVGGQGIPIIEFLHVSALHGSLRNRSGTFGQAYWQRRERFIGLFECLAALGNADA